MAISTISVYQEKAMVTCTESSKNVPYMSLNLAGEVGELIEKLAQAGQLVHDDRVARFIEVAAELGALAKLIRKGEADYPMPDPDNTITLNDAIAKEVGDVFWQNFGLCSVAGWQAKAIMQMNLDKLAARAERGTIVGSGDER